MTGSGKVSGFRTKRELLAMLVEEVCRWPGTDKLADDYACELEQLMDLLDRCPLFLGEQHWLELSRIWLLRALSTPDAWLRELWVLTLGQWWRYLEVSGYAADATPYSEQPKINAPFVRGISGFPKAGK